MCDEVVSEKMLALEKMRRDFVANVSHELRTPLTVIHGYLETLLTEVEDQNAWKSIFEQMYQQTIRMENIIEDLLLLSSLEHNENKKHKSICLAKMIETICKEAKILSGSAQHKFHTSLDTVLCIMGDKKELSSLLTNLIFNAVKYTPAHHDIFINWYSKNHSAVLEVRDTGIGIAKKHIPRLTERFYRVDKARSRDSGGTGLGLAIVKHVLSRHGAELSVVSEVGVGSTFTCVFPLSL